VSQKLLSAPLSHYNVILGEPWLQDNNVIMDCAHNVKWQRNNAALMPVTFGSQQRSDPFIPAPQVQAIDLQYKMNERATMISYAIATGMHHATMMPVDRQSEMAYFETAGKWRKCESYFRASTPWLVAWVGHELSGLAPHQCK